MGKRVKQACRQRRAVKSERRRYCLPRQGMIRQLPMADKAQTHPVYFIFQTLAPALTAERIPARAAKADSASRCPGVSSKVKDPAGRGRLAQQKRLLPRGTASGRVKTQKTDSGCYRFVGRTVITGMSAPLTTFSATEPKRIRSMPLRPCVPMMIRSAPIVPTIFRISSAA